jgi:hypothetical protein
MKVTFPSKQIGLRPHLIGKYVDFEKPDGFGCYKQSEPDPFGCFGCFGCSGNNSTLARLIC